MSLFAILTLLTSHTPAPPPSPYPETITTAPKGIITPPVHPLVQNGWDVSIEGSFIWWQMTVHQAGNIKESYTSPYSYFYQLTPGFRISLGMDPGFDGWDLKAAYTQIGTNWTTNGHTVYDPTLSSLPVYRKYFLKNSLYTLDLELGREFFISKHVTLRPNVGMKVGRLFYKEKYETVLNPIEEIPNRQRASGLGIRGGLDSTWNLTSHWGLFADFYGTTFWASILSYEHPVFPSQHTHNLIPVLETALGIHYQTHLSHERLHILAKLGWEEQLWLNYYQDAYFIHSAGYGNLLMQGLTASFRLAF